MTKATVLKDTKPKLRQTKLCFAPTKVFKKLEDFESTEKLEQSIKLLNIGKEHIDPCEKCKKNVMRIHCTVLKPNNICPVSYCVQCVEKHTGETLDSIKHQDIIYVNKHGVELEHTDATPKWACLVCRGLCECNTCQPVKSNKDESSKNDTNRTTNNNTHNNNHNNHSHNESFFKINMNSIKSATTITNTNNTTSTTTATPTTIRFPAKEPELPTLSPIALLYPEQDIWVRLQIREWMHRFGDLYDFDLRVISLQNVQSDWRSKRLGAHVVWKLFSVVKSGGLVDEKKKVTDMIKYVMQDWIKDKKLARLVNTEDAIHQALFDVMTRDGVSPRRWQQLAEVLACAGYRQIPVPTVNRTEEDDDMDIDDEIKRYQTDTRSSHLMSLSDELTMIHLLLDLLLLDAKARQSLSEVPKELRELEADIKKERKQHAIEDLKKKSHKSGLVNRISHLQHVKGSDVSALETELDELETAIRDEQLAMETRELEYIKYNLKCQKRWSPIGHDHFGNQYWTFSDMVDHTSHAAYSRNNEPFWAFGIIVIGPGYQQQEEESWWSISGTREMAKLEKWLLSLPKEQQAKDFLVQLRRHVQYLKSLEWVVYGEGFFS